MIQATWDVPHCRVTLRGHAGSGDYGNDAVCAAATILTYTLADGLQELVEKGMVSHGCAILEPGYARISYRGKSPRAKALFRRICRGYRLLAQATPAQFSLEIKQKTASPTMRV